MSMIGCQFCERIRKVHPNVRSASKVMSFRDGYPLTPGHTLVVPVLHLPTMGSLAPDSLLELWTEVQHVTLRLKSNYKDISGFNIGINEGAAAGQTIPHLHVHVIPRRLGDVKDPKGGIRWIMAGKAAYWNSGLPPHTDECELMVNNKGGRICSCGVGGF